MLGLSKISKLRGLGSIRLVLHFSIYLDESRVVNKNQMLEKFMVS